MREITRKRYDLVDEYSTPNVVFEKTYEDSTLVNIRVSVCLSNGVVVLHDPCPINMIDKLNTIREVLANVSTTEHWVYNEASIQQSETHKLGSNNVRSIATVSLMRTGTCKVKFAISDCTKTCSETFTDSSYPMFYLDENIRLFTNNFKKSLKDIVRKLEDMS